MDVSAVVKGYLAECHGIGRSEPIDDAAPLVDLGLLDSIAMMQLVTFLETRFDIEFRPRDLDLRRAQTISQLAAVVESKLAEKR